MKTTEERFWEKVDKSGECWEWTACKVRNGYGQFKLDGRPQQAHRVSWRLAHGDIPQGEGYHGTCVCHTCDNPSCVRPDHLFLGTNADNLQDMAEKGRSTLGSLHPNAKLTEEDIPLIREYLRYGCTQKYIGSLFGVRSNQISRINTGKSWSHI